uniref:Uncharacterized protein n=1 Tax=Megaviridae environmental sample TaxID=1737588 RepID=A0A5J6VLT5_9VIRU|nr:MAG: hypothetical protein [Megaviridae environmental sample]
METSKEDINIEEYQVHSSVDKIKLYCLYICSDLTLEKITTTEIQLNTKNKLTKAEIKYLIKLNDRLSNDKFKLITIFKHNVNNEAQNIVNGEDISSFLDKQTKIDDITFEKTSKVFMDLNSLFFLYFKKDTKTIPLISTKKLFTSGATKTKKTIN